MNRIVSQILAPFPGPLQRQTFLRAFLSALLAAPPFAATLAPRPEYIGGKTNKP